MPLKLLSTVDLLVDAQDGVVRLTLNRPEKRNALSLSLLGDLSIVLSRIAEYRNPEWELTALNEFRVNGEWGCTLAMACQGLAGTAKSFIMRQQIGQTMLEDANYDAVTAGRMRIARRRGPLVPIAAINGASANRSRRSA